MLATQPAPCTVAQPKERRRWRFLVLLAALLFAGCALGVAADAPAPTAAPAARKPAILFALPGEARYAYVGFDYMRQLQEAGFEVDYTEGSAELTWERLQGFNAVVVLAFAPTGPDDAQGYYALRPPWWEAQGALLERYLAAGGGVFLLNTNNGQSNTPNAFMRAKWGLQMPLAVLHDPSAVPLSHLPKVSASYTTAVLPSPVSEGVKGVWLPLGQHYVGAHTMPILVDDSWTPVLRSGATAYTLPPNYDRGGIQPRPDALIPTESLRDSTLMAVRELPGGGRLAAAQVWYPFTVGSGYKWLYDGELMEKGLNGRRSDLALLLRNTYSWLAAPSRAAGKLGGHVTDPDRLLEPQLRSTAFDRFHEWVYQEEEVLEYRRPPSHGRLFRGLIGAETAYSGGSGSVADFAAAASAAGLDYVIFLEDFDRLTPEKLAALTADCKAASTPTLMLIPGYRMRTNTGNHVFGYSLNPPWPEERLLVGEQGRTFNLQYQDEKGEWARGNASLDWTLNTWYKGNGNWGYYRFQDSGDGMRMSDLRAYSAAAVRTWDSGTLLEDNTEEYLLTCASFSVPTPMSLHLVRSPAALTAAANAGQGLTYAQARKLDTLMTDALRWSHSYDGLNVFPTDGPLIRAWPRCFRVFTFGAERFVSGRALDIAPIHITSDVGLKEIRIYNGTRLFRRFDAGGTKDYQTTLYLNAEVQRSLVLVAEDLKGGTAVSFAHRSYKEGTLAPVFCGDHVNDCGNMHLAHGPHWPGFFKIPTLPDSFAGGTWDGGAHLAQRPLATGQFAVPRVSTSLGTINETPYQTPIQETSDSGFTRNRMVSDRRLVPLILRGWANPWSGFGPLEPNALYRVTGVHTYYDQYRLGVEPMSYGAPGITAGPYVGLFEERFTFKQDQTLKSLGIWYAGWRAKTVDNSVLVAIGSPDGTIRDVIDATTLPDKPIRHRLATGDWLAFYSSALSNTVLLINRGPAAVFTLNPPTAYWMTLEADLTDPATPANLKAGASWGTEFFSTVWPIDQSLRSAADLADAVRWYADPVGLELLRGERGPRRGGLLELRATDGAVELALPREARFSATLPVRVDGLNPRWTAGLWQYAGYRTHYYSKADSGYCELGLDLDGRAWFPVFASMAPRSHVLAGHPVVADAAGHDLFITVTRLRDEPPLWHVAVNNPTDAPITATLHAAMTIPGLDFPAQTLTLAPGARVELLPKVVEATPTAPTPAP